MARKSHKNLQLSVSVEYNVYNWKLWEQQTQDNIEMVLRAYGQEVKREVNILVGKDTATGPGPHPHRTDHNFSWEDTGKLAEAVDFAFKGRGYLKTVEIYVEPVTTDDGDIVDYGTFLEVGWHPKVPKRGGGMRQTGKFYAYPWISLAVAKANMTILKIIPAELTKGLPQFQLFGKARTEEGVGIKVQQNKFIVSENITSAVDTYASRAGGKGGVAAQLSGWLEPWKGVTNVQRVPGIRTTKVRERILKAI